MNTRTRSCILVALAAATSFGPTFPARAAGLSKEAIGIQRSIRSAIERSPDRLIAGVIEVSGSPKCDGPGPDARCVQEATIVRLFSSKGVKLQDGDRMTVLGSGSVGDRTIAVLVPIPGDGTVWGATFMSNDTGEFAVRDLRDALREEGL